MRGQLGAAGRWVVLGILAVAAAAAVFAVTSRRGGGQGRHTAVERVERGPFARDVSGTGTVQAARTRVLGFKTTGTVLEIPVSEGQQVETGTVLARLDTGALQRDLASNQAALRSAQAELERIRAQQTVDRLDVQSAVASAENELAGAKEARQEAAGKEATTRRLFEAGAASENELRSATDALAQADRRLRSAQLALEQARARAASFDQLAGAQIKSAEANIASLETAIANLTDQQQDAVLRAPFAGVVTDIGFEAGDTVGPGQGTLELVDVSRLSVTAHFDENRALELASGQPATIIPDADTARELPAVVRRVSAVANRSSGAAQVEAELDFVDVGIAQEAGVVRPGYTVTVKVSVNRLQDVLLVPLEAVSERDGVGWVYRIEPAAPGRGTARRVEVAIADRNATVAAVTGGGLKGGDLIAVINVGELSDGQPVEYAPLAGGGAG